MMPYDQEIKRLSLARILMHFQIKLDTKQKIKKSTELCCINTNQEDSWHNNNTLTNHATFLGYDY